MTRLACEEATELVVHYSKIFIYGCEIITIDINQN